MPIAFIDREADQAIVYSTLSELPEIWMSFQTLTDTLRQRKETMTEKRIHHALTSLTASGSLEEHKRAAGRGKIWRTKKENHGTEN